ncbi:MAG: hypothetical protein RMI79_04675 [Nitrososphaerota archaeon]|nr:hypothetical protein [Nitrososphaerota archaeon]
MKTLGYIADDLEALKKNVKMLFERIEESNLEIRRIEVKVSGLASKVSKKLSIFLE